MNKSLKAELDSWLCGNDLKRRKWKLERETARYPRLYKQMGLNLIDLEDKEILDIGCGPSGILNIIKAKLKLGVDPLAEEYKKYYENNYYLVKGIGEDLPLQDNEIDVVISMNSLDHCENPEKVIEEVKRVLRPSGWFAVLFCLNLVTNNPHPSHIQDIDKDNFHDWIDSDFETVHEKTIKYGWVKYQNKCGLPALAGLYRLTTKGT